MEESMGSEGELSSGYKLVPWSTWDQWSFVKHSIFSSSPYSVSKALQRITAWRSRGCLPVHIDVTAAIIEIQHKDPFFTTDDDDDDDPILDSDELLSMLYSMAITRLVNCFVEPSHKKTGRSISELADAVGIPRMLVDIRHESSHRNLPSIRLLRMASIKALDWLKSNYWESQGCAIPDVRKEIRSRLREMNFLLKAKHTQRLSSSKMKGIRARRAGVLLNCNRLSSQMTIKLRPKKSDGSEKHFSKLTKIVARLYSSYPTEVVSVLLEFFHVEERDLSEGIDREHTDDSSVDDPEPVTSSVHDLKTIITKLSSKKPMLILSILKTVLEMIEIKESSLRGKGRCHSLSSQYEDEASETSHLCSLVLWLLVNLKQLKDSGQIGVIDESKVLSKESIAGPKVSLVNLLRKCLTLSVLGDKHLLGSILLLVEMIGNHYLTAKFKKLPLLCPKGEQFAEDCTSHDTCNMFSEEDCIQQATEKLEFLKERLRNRRNKSIGSKDVKTDAVNRTWSVAKSWTPCPIGMLPCSFSSTAVLPVLDKVEKSSESNSFANNERVAEMNNDKVVSDHDIENSEEEVYVDENESPSKRIRLTREVQELDLPEVTTGPLEGRLLIDGVWKKVSEKELLAIESDIKIFV